MDDNPIKELPDFWRGIRNSVKSRRGDSICKRLAGNCIPLSFGQERLWRLQQLQGKGAAHNITQHARLMGELNVPALQQAIEFLIDRHEIFRTSIRLNDGKPSQNIETAISFTLEETDLSSLDIADRKSESQRLIAEFTNQSIDVEQAPLWRIHLLRISENEHYLLRTVHHLIFDHWSGSVFHRETALLYAAFAEQQPSPLKSLPIQYGDYAVWQRHILNPAFIEAAMEFWRGHLSDNSAPLELPYNNRPSDRLLNREGALATHSIPEPLIHALSKFSEQQGVSLFVVFLAIFKILLHACTGQRDLVVCIPVSGRDRVELRGLIGYFNNIIALRSEIRPELKISEVLSEVSHNTLDSQPFQNLPFQKLSEITARAGIQLNRAAFSMLNTPSRPVVMGDISIESIKTAKKSEDFELFWAIHRHVGQWNLVVRYRTALFEPDSIMVLMEKYILLLERISANPSATVSELCELVKP